MGFRLSEDFDLDLLAAPLPNSSVGVDVRLDGSGIFFRLKDLRTEARALEREAVSAPDQETPIVEAGLREWSELSDLAIQALSTTTKDLEIASWLCEAQVRLRSFQGLVDGLELLQRFVDGYWDAGLYPEPDEDGLITRIAPVGNLFGLSGVAALVQPIRLLPLSDHAPDLALWRVETAFAPLQGGDDPAARERIQTRRAEQVDEVRQGLFRASPAFLRAVHGNARLAVEHIETLAEALDKRADVGRFGSQITQLLSAIVELLESQVGDRLVEHVDVAVEVSQTTEPGHPATGAPARGDIANREQAYETLLRISDFFATTEPQSLVSKSLREVVRRARLPLDSLLAELLPEAAERTLFLQRAGVKDDTVAEQISGYE